jgi:ubiquinone biosynthesis protein
VLRPGIERRFAQDLRGFYRAARLIERIHPPSRRLRPVAVVDTLARTVALEMDLRLEAAAISEMAENTRDDPGFRVPAVDWSRTARRVLTTEWIGGIHLSDHAALRAAGLDPKELAERIIQTFLRHAMRDGFFHADMHPGNLFVAPDGRLVAVDFGITGRLAPKERRFLAEMLYGFIQRDYLRVAEVHFEADYVPPGQSVYAFAQALRAIGEPLRDRTARDIAMSRVLTQLFEVTELFDMHTRPELILLQKTMVVVEGVARSLDPDLDMWHAAEPVVGEWIGQNLGPAGRLQAAAEGASAIGRLLSDLPTHLAKLERATANLAAAPGGGLPIAPESLNAFAEAQRRLGRGRRLALWVAALALVVLAVQSLW